MVTEVTYMTTEQVAELLGVSPRTLEDWRYKGGGPRFRKLGRAVRYRRSDVIEWAESQTCENTSQQPRAALG